MASSLALSEVYVLDAGSELFIWYSGQSSLMSRSKAQLIAEKINKHERKYKSTIIPVRAVSRCVCGVVCLFVCVGMEREV